VSDCVAIEDVFVAGDCVIARIGLSQIKTALQTCVYKHQPVTPVV
jgi:hypothetical protein